MTTHWSDKPKDPNALEPWLFIIVVVLMGYVLFQVGRSWL